MDNDRDIAGRFPSIVNKRRKLANIGVRIEVPISRRSALVKNWRKLSSLIVQDLHLRVRFNMHTNEIEIRGTLETPNISYLQKGLDLVRAFIVGFKVNDVSLLLITHYCIAMFKTKKLKRIDRQSRVIGLLTDTGGRTKTTIENLTQTGIIITENKIYILGDIRHVELARRAIYNLVFSACPIKIFRNLRYVAGRIDFE